MLLAGAEGDRWAEAVATLRARKPLPLSCVRVAADDPGGVSDAEFKRKYGVGQGGAVLVRPDGVIAWRARELASDIAGDLRGILRRLGIAVAS